LIANPKSDVAVNDSHCFGFSFDPSVCQIGPVAAQVTMGGLRTFAADANKSYEPLKAATFVRGIILETVRTAQMTDLLGKSRALRADWRQLCLVSILVYDGKLRQV